MPLGNFQQIFSYHPEGLQHVSNRVSACFQLIPYQQVFSRSRSSMSSASLVPVGFLQVSSQQISFQQVFTRSHSSRSWTGLWQLSSNVPIDIEQVSNRASSTLQRVLDRSLTAFQQSFSNSPVGFQQVSISSAASLHEIPTGLDQVSWRTSPLLRPGPPKPPTDPLGRHQIGRPWIVNICVLVEWNWRLYQFQALLSSLFFIARL